MTMGVGESQSGTMLEAEGRKDISPSEEGRKDISPVEKGKTPDEASKVSPEQEPLVYTQAQAEVLMHAAKSEAGRELTDVRTERDNLKGRIETAEKQISDMEAERESLQSQIEDLSSNDPAKFDLIKRDKDLRDKIRQHEANVKALGDREKAISEREKEHAAFKFDVDIETVVDEYEDGDSTRLRNALRLFENPTEEQIRSVADSLFGQKAESSESESKGAEPPPTKPVKKPDSGKSRGGSTYFTRSQIADRAFWEANKDAILEAQKEGRIRDE